MADPRLDLSKLKAIKDWSEDHPTHRGTELDMRVLLVVLLLASCTTDGLADLRARQAADEACAKCRDEMKLQKDRDFFQERCNLQCAPAPGVADSSDPSQKKWRCGCIPAEKKS